MKIKSADKITVNYPLKKELTPVILGIALSISGYATESSDAYTEMEISKIVTGKQEVLYKYGEHNDNDAVPPCKTALPSSSFEGVLIAGMMPASSQIYTAGEESNISNEVFPPSNTDISTLDLSQSINSPNMVLQRGYKIDTPMPWKSTEKPSALLGFPPSSIYPQTYGLEADEEIPYKF